MARSRTRKILTGSAALLTARVAFLAAAVSAYLATEFGRFVYRPWVRRNGVEDFGLADCVGNLGGIVVQIFLTLAILNPTRKVSFSIDLKKLREDRR